MYGGGKDRLTLTPLTPEGNLLTDDPSLDGMVGCHSGPYIHLNVINPEPGFEYIWERNTGRDKMAARQRGGRPVGANDPEMAAMNALMDDGGPTPIDSSYVYGDVILHKYPIEAIRRRRENEEAKNSAAMRDGAALYAERAAGIEAQLSRGLPSRFARRDHGLEYKDAQDHTVEHWVPTDGIIREG